VQRWLRPDGAGIALTTNSGARCEGSRRGDDGHAAGIRGWIAAAMTSMHKGTNGLAAVVQNTLDENPLLGRCAFSASGART